MQKLPKTATGVVTNFQFLCGFESISRYGVWRERWFAFQFLCGFEFFSINSITFLSSSFQFLCGFELFVRGSAGIVAPRLSFNSFADSSSYNARGGVLPMFRYFQFLCGFEGIFLVSEKLKNLMSSFNSFADSR